MVKIGRAAALQWSPDGKQVWWLTAKRLPDHSPPSPEAVRIVHLRVEPVEDFEKRTMATLEALRALDSLRTKKAKRFLAALEESIIGFALKANFVLQPVRVALQSDSDSAVEHQMDLLT